MVTKREILKIEALDLTRNVKNAVVIDSVMHIFETFGCLPSLLLLASSRPTHSACLDASE